MSLLKDIKKAVANAGSSKGKIIYFKADQKVRIRFLQDIEDGIKIPFHDSFALGVNEPCQKVFGRKCLNHDNEELRTRDLYAWSVYDYEANEVKILLSAVNNWTSIPALIGMYESYGTLLDRDYIIKRTGAGTNTSYSVVPMDKAKFKNKKAKPYSEKEMFKIIDKAFPAENSSKSDEEDEPEVEEDWDVEEEDFQSLSAKELYKLCVDREIEAKPKKKKAYYIELLEAADDELEEDEISDEIEEDDIEDEEDDW